MVSKPVAGAIAAVVIAGAAGVLVWANSGSGLTEGAPAPAASAPASAGVSSSRIDPVTAAGGGTSGTSGSSSSGGGMTIPTASAPEAVAALCQVRPIAITSMLGGAKGDGRFEALRDAIPVLGERLQNVQDVAAGRPAVKPVLIQVKGLYDDWTTALTAYDAGRTTSSQKAMKSAQATLGALDDVMKKALPASAEC